MAVAIKCITRKNVSKSSENLLDKEINILKELSQLKHANVVSLLDCKQTPRFFYLVMEVSGSSEFSIASLSRISPRPKTLKRVRSWLWRHERLE